MVLYAIPTSLFFRAKYETILFKGRYGFSTFYDKDNIYIFGGSDDNPCDDMLRLDMNNKEWVKHYPVR